MSRRVRIIVIAFAAGAVVVALAALIWWFTRDEAPEAVDLESAVAQVQAATDSAAESDATGSAEASAATGSAEASAATGSAEASDEGTTSADGNSSTAVSASSGGGADTADDAGDTAPPKLSSEEAAADAEVWTVQTAVGKVDLLDQPAVSFAGFRVDEVLAGGIGDFTAVGRTADVTGYIGLTDTTLVAAEVTVDFTTLRTDNGSRDSQVQRALNTSEFPVAVFTLTEPVDVPDPSSFSGSAVGDLTIKGVTNRAVFDLQARLVDDTIVVVGSVPVVFADYGVRVPSAPVVVSAEDHGIMEFQLLFTR